MIENHSSHHRNRSGVWNFSKTIIAVVFSLLFAFFFTGCQEPQNPVNQENENPPHVGQEKQYPETLTEQEKTDIKGLSFSSLEDSLESFNKIITILEAHKDEESVSTYLSKIKTVREKVKAGNLKVLTAKTLDVNALIQTAENNVEAVEYLSVNYTDENGDFQIYKNAEEYNAKQRDAVNKREAYLDYVHNEYSSALNSYANALTAAYNNQPAYDAIKNYVKRTVEDFKDNYKLDNNYNAAEIQNLVDAAKTEQANLQNGSAYSDKKVALENAETELKRLESEAKQAVAAANNFVFEKEDEEEQEEVTYQASIFISPQTQYKVGETFSLSGLCIQMSGSDGSADYIYSEIGFSYDMPDMSTAGIKEVEIKFYYKGVLYTASFIIEVRAVEIEEFVKISFVTNCDVKLEPIRISKGHNLRFYNSYIDDVTDGNQYSFGTEKLKKENYVFSEWFFDEKFSIPLPANYDNYWIEQDITLYAKWQPVSSFKIVIEEYDKDIVVNRTESATGISFIAPDDYDSYAWFIDSIPLGNIDKSCFIKSDEITSGIHELLLIARKDGHTYSYRASLIIQ